jgi:hypothetical protein
MSQQRRTGPARGAPTRCSPRFRSRATRRLVATRRTSCAHHHGCPHERRSRARRPPRKDESRSALEASS